jgi:hypothetical protein
MLFGKVEKLLYLYDWLIFFLRISFLVIIFMVYIITQPRTSSCVSRDVDSNKRWLEEREFFFLSDILSDKEEAMFFLVDK